MKKVVICLLLLVLTLSLAGCGIKQKMEQKAGEAIAEKILGGSSDSKVDIDGDTLTVTGEDGKQMTVGGTEWPKSDLAKRIPEFKGGKVIWLLESDDGVQISLEEVKADDAAAYIEKIKEDFAVDAYEMKSEDSLTYGASNADGYTAVLFYGSGSFTITVTVPNG